MLTADDIKLLLMRLLHAIPDRKLVMGIGSITLAICDVHREVFGEVE